MTSPDKGGNLVRYQQEIGVLDEKGKKDHLGVFYLNLRDFEQDIQRIKAGEKYDPEKIIIPGDIQNSSGDMNRGYMEASVLVGMKMELKADYLKKLPQDEYEDLKARLERIYEYYSQLFDFAQYL